MRFSILRSSAVVACLALMAACQAGVESLVSVPPRDAPPVTPPVTPPDPSPTSGTRTFSFASGVSEYQVHAYTTNSRFVLRGDGSFSLEYPGFAYKGRYTEANGTLVFTWEGWSLAGPWGATGFLDGTTLRISYNFIMQMTDFEDAVYTRSD